MMNVSWYSTLIWRINYIDLISKRSLKINFNNKFVNFCQHKKKTKWCLPLDHWYIIPLLERFFFSLRLQSLGFTGVHCQKWKVTLYLQKQMAHCTLGVCFGIQGKREKWSDAFTESSKRQLFWKNHWSRLLPLKGIRRAPAGAIQEPLAPLIAHWSERIIFVNATLPGVELYRYGSTHGSQA